MPRPIARLLVAVPAIVMLFGLAAAPAAAAEGLEMSARALLDGHTRVGSWMAIAVDLSNDGPPVVGELRVAAGVTGTSRFSVPVDLPTQSAKTYVIHAQPSFGVKVTVALVTSTGTIAEQAVEVTAHDPGQTIVGIIAERPESIGRILRAPQQVDSAVTEVVLLKPADLPDRVEAWAAIDRLVWQDIDADALSTGQLQALEAWIVGGGRLVIVGGTTGADTLSGLPDELLPFRPSAIVDAPPASLAGLVGVTPAEATDLPAMAGPLGHGRALARVGDQVIVGEAAHGAGAVTIVGVDPTAGWLATAPGTEALWRRLLPARSQGGPITDDSGLIRAVSQLPALALPPIGGLLALLAGYIVLVGPVNYLVLRRLDRREWAWVSIPLLIVGFSVGAYAMGAAIRGSDVIVHQVAIIRGSGDDGQGAGLVYAGIYSPTRRTYQLSVPGGALLAGSVNDVFAGAGGSSVDVVQGEPALVRDLAVGFGSLRTIRAELPRPVPTIEADLVLRGETLVGTLRNTSDLAIDRPAVVLGTNVQSWPTLAPGASVEVELDLDSDPFGEAATDKIIGPLLATDDAARTKISIKQELINTLTIDPVFGFSGRIQSDSLILLGWSDDAMIDVDIAGDVPRTASTTLYQVPLPFRASGDIVYRGDLIRSTVVSIDGQSFNKDPNSLTMGQGSMTANYRPLQVGGDLAVSRLSLLLSQGGIARVDVGSVEIAPTGPAIELDPCLQADCPAAGETFLPDVEILDRTTGTWMALPRLDGSTTYDVTAPDRYVDPLDGTVWIRFQNLRIDPMIFTLGVRIEGTAK